MEITVKYASPLLEYLCAALAPQSRTKIKSLLAHSMIEVNGKARTAFDFPLEAGDKICVLHGKKPRTLSCKDIKIIYEDQWLIVADKRSGLPSISTGQTGEATAYSILTDYAHQTWQGRIFIVHRLDRDTSGLLVFAKDEQTKMAMQEHWNECIVARKYAAVAENSFKDMEGSIVSWLKENPRSLKMNSSTRDNGGKKAITRYKVIRQENGLALTEIELETGRKNQIRVQFAAAGHPIAGDRKYGARSNPFGRLALHAFLLAFRHPRTGETLSFTSPVPFRL